MTLLKNNVHGNKTDQQSVVMAHIVGGSRGWTSKLQCVYEWLLVVPGGIPVGGVGEILKIDSRHGMDKVIALNGINM